MIILRKGNIFFVLRLEFHTECMSGFCLIFFWLKNVEFFFLDIDRKRDLTRVMWKEFDI